MRGRLALVVTLIAAGALRAAEEPVTARDIRWAVTEIDVAPYRPPKPSARRERNAVFEKVARLCRRSPALLELLIAERLSDTNPRIRAATVEVLCLAGETKALENVERILFFDAHFDVRKRAARMLVAFGRPQLTDSVLRPWPMLKADELRQVRSGPHFDRIERALVDALFPRNRLLGYSRSGDAGLAGRARNEMALRRLRGTVAESRERAERGFRRELIALLGLICSEESVDALAGLAADNDETLAVAACNALAAIGTPGAQAALAAGLQSDHEPVSSACLYHLNRAGVMLDLAVVKRLLASENVAIQRYAARAAAASPAGEARGMLRASLGKRDSLVRRTAIEALGAAGDAASAAALADTFATGSRHESALAAAALAEIGSRIERAVPGPSRSEAQAAAVRMGRVASEVLSGGPGTKREAISAGLSDPDAGVRAAALRAAGDLLGRGASGDLVAALEDRDGLVQVAAARALGVIWRLGSGDEPGTRGMTGGPRDAADALLDTASRGGARLCTAAYEALGHMALAELASVLVERLRAEKRPAVRRVIACTLRRLTGRSFGDDPDRWHEWIGAGGMAGRSPAG